MPRSNNTLRRILLAAGLTVRGIVWLACGVIFAAVALFDSAQAQTNFRILYTFQGAPDGAVEVGGLIMDAERNLYGTTEYGGDGTFCSGGCGTVFKLAPHGVETVLHSFDYTDGTRPLAGLIADAAGNLYGTTSEGDKSGNTCLEGCGVVFRLAPDGTETTLYAFSAKRTNGHVPRAGLAMDPAGNLYGTTSQGGNKNCSEGCGTVFKVAPDGTETVLHVFQGGSDGFGPLAGLILDGAGNLYGTTLAGGGTGCSGGLGCGTVFKLAPDGTETVLHAFQGGSDGAEPVAALIADAAGNLFGTTEAGGGTGCGGGGCGTVFMITPDDTESVFYSFKGGSDGAAPEAPLIIDQSGNLFGTTYGGGGAIRCGGCGTVFELAPGGTETLLHVFDRRRFGSHPTAPLIPDKKGNLYGTTGSTVFELSP